MNKGMPVILTIGGYDPTGGAGISADIRTISSLECYPISLISCLTSQNTNQFKLLESVNPNLFKDQAESLLSDFKIDLIKIGVLASVEIVKETKKILESLEGIKVVVDPVIESSSGGLLANHPTLEAIKELIFPDSYLITPNLSEAEVLSNKKDLDSIIKDPFMLSSNFLLIKDIAYSKDTITNNLYSKTNLLKSWSVTKEKGNFHGTGCYLASCISCFLAQSKNIEEAINLGLQKTMNGIEGSFTTKNSNRILRPK